MTALLELDAVTKRFARGRITALEGVDLRVRAGEHVGLIGSSGAGKSTLAQLVVGLRRPDAGRVLIDGDDLSGLRGRRRRAVARKAHLVFQNAYAALPAWRLVGEVVAEPLVIHRLAAGADLEQRVGQALSDAGLDPSLRSRHVTALSGGELQRVALARAVVARPQLIVADEPTAMLDASTRTDLLATLAALGQTHGVAVLHITHYLALAGAFCGRIVVLADGRVVEEGPAETVLSQPTHDATRRLRAAAATLHGTA